GGGRPATALRGKDRVMTSVGEDPPRHRDLGDVEVPVGKRDEYAHRRRRYSHDGPAHSDDRRYAATRAANCPHAASMSRPRVSRTVAPSPRRSSESLNAPIAFGLDPVYGESVGLYGMRLTLNLRGSRSSASWAAWT